MCIEFWKLALVALPSRTGWTDTKLGDLFIAPLTGKIIWWVLSLDHSVQFSDRDMGLEDRLTWLTEISREF